MRRIRMPIGTQTIQKRNSGKGIGKPGERKTGSSILNAMKQMTRQENMRTCGSPLILTRT
jgi:hypothetical protein